jgi:5-methylcytosine-specific restriction endonuclease McrA
LVAKLVNTKAPLSHRVPEGDRAAIFEEARQALIDKVEKDRFAVRPPRKRKAPAKAKSAKTTRHIPNTIKREVYERNAGQCNHVARNGHRCEAQSRLELHHVKPWGMGGVHSAANIALVCRAHNRLAAEADYGAEFMRGRIRQRELSSTPAR